MRRMKTPTSTTLPELVDEQNLSLAWSKVFMRILENPGTTISPLVVSITGLASAGDPEEDPAVRGAIDACLRARGDPDVETVAWTIFPQSLWRLVCQDRQRLYQLYKGTVERYKAMNRAKNGRGLYFERLIAFGGGPEDGNQLEWIIKQHGSRTGVRTSMLQAAVFDPRRDHVASAQLGFPCLQHVALTSEGSALSLNAFYATQQIFDKAYGNWLGLYHLGQFMAREMGLVFDRFTCFVGVEKLDRPTKSDAGLRAVAEAARDCIKRNPGQPELIKGQR
jgi:hypothetical protein